MGGQFRPDFTFIVN